MKNLILVTAIVLIGVSCTYYDHEFPYDFENVSELIELDDKMDEISGLFYKNDSILYAVKDEEGEIFEVNLKTNKHSKIADFKKKGDFEGIAKSGNSFFVLKSDGDIYKVNYSGTEKYTFPDDEKGFEFEGLTVDKEERNLYVSCKQHGKKNKNDKVFVYSFSLSNMKYQKKPFLILQKNVIHKNFKPSGIAMSPYGNLFLISAISNTIVEVTKSGDVVNKAQLPLLIYNQIEGICFDLKGNLFLSSEKGEQDHAKIIRLNKN